MSTPPGGPPPPNKGGLILLGIAIGAVATLMLVILFLGLAWLGFRSFHGQSTPPQVVTLNAPPVARPPGQPPMVRVQPVERFERTERVQRTERAEDIEPAAPETPASIAPVLHVRSRGGNLLDGKPVVLETSGTVSSSDGYLRVMDSRALRISGPMSVSVWFNARSFDHAMTLGSRALNGPPWQFPYSSWLVRVNNDTHFEASLAGGGYSPSTWKVPRLNPGQWYHAVMTYDGRTKKLFLNGERMTQLASGGLDHATPIAITPGRAIFIGADEGESPVGDLFDGAIDDVRLFNRALSDLEILEIFTKSAKGGGGGTGTRL